MLMQGRLVACVLVALPPVLLAQESTAPPIGPREISGFWELSFDGRAVPKADLLPTVTSADVEARERGGAHAIRWCNLLGMPFLMDSGRPLDLRVGSSVVILVAENGSAPRYLYLGRESHIDSEIYDPSTNGDSIARWEGDTLVVDTVGFDGTRGITAIPGGGFRTEKSHLVERYRLLKDGAVLSVTFTWTDPDVFRTPHTYEFRYSRLPASYEPQAWVRCDPYDPERAAFLESVGTAPADGH